MLKFKVGDRVLVTTINEVGTVLGYAPLPSVTVSVLLDTQKECGKSLGFGEGELELLMDEEPESYSEFMCEPQKHTAEAIKENPVNPSHYRVNGIPEAIDIMRGLMTDEQLEGFLWGNILKYAYRYGRKGTTQGAKTETAAKIKWYADAMIGYLSGH